MCVYIINILFFFADWWTFSKNLGANKEFFRYQGYIINKADKTNTRPWKPLNWSMGFLYSLIKVHNPYIAKYLLWKLSADSAKGSDKKVLKHKLICWYLYENTKYTK